ncbi:MAG: 30S ribosomal protein S3 [Candidatus Iainarchaeum archaeon]|uniref:30S ribosomal protein S3 n=1 Tax=Candidatus Iainarchaeum sp. TaxID=3101447 RepID=A0A7T9I212_9ARCH|nr:MAG: 30S ribosomal protein S3 [Candidatus Diapherotrites archaeon]
MIEKGFTKQAVNKVRLYQYMKKELDRAGFTELDIVKTPLVTRIVIHVSKPGLAIGKGGQNIRTLTETINREYGIENPQIEIKEITTPELDSKSVIDRMKSAIERGFAWRSVAFKTLEDVYRAGAQGVEIILSGKLAGKGGRKKQVRFSKGYMKKVGDQTKLVDQAKVTSYPKVGAIGLTVRIIRPGVFFPDKMNVKEYIAKKKARDAGVVEAQPVATETKEPEAAA